MTVYKHKLSTMFLAILLINNNMSKVADKCNQNAGVITESLGIESNNAVEIMIQHATAAVIQSDWLKLNEWWFKDN